MMFALAGSGHYRVMDAPKQSGTRRSEPASHSVHNGQHHDHDHDHEQAGPGIDLPLLGHVEYKSVGFLAGLGIAGAAGVIEWPVAAAVGIGYALSRQEHRE